AAPARNHIYSRSSIILRHNQLECPKQAVTYLPSLGELSVNVLNREQGDANLRRTHCIDPQACDRDRARVAVDVTAPIDGDLPDANGNHDCGPERVPIQAQREALEHDSRSAGRPAGRVE